MINDIEIIRKRFSELADNNRAVNSKRYLKSPYEFYGLKCPDMRKICKDYKKMDFYSALNLFDELWKSGNHEEMCFGLYLLSNYAKQNQIELWKFLIQRFDKLKTWDHVDEMSGRTLGVILADNINLTSEIKKMSESKNPWIRRTSIVSTGKLIGKNKIDLTLLLAEKLVYDDDVYVQKGAGWMLREAGKRNRLAVREFILRHLDMKPNAFSYATEKMTELREVRKEKIRKEKEKKKSL